MPDRRVYIDNLGCYRRSLDASKLREYFLSNHCQIVDDPKDADSIIVVTCAVFKAPEETAMTRVEELHRKYGDRVIVAGCLPAINPTRLGRVHDGPTISTREIDEVDRLFPEFGVRYSDLPDANTFTGFKYPAGVRESLMAFRYNSWRNYRRVLYCLTRRSTTPFNIRIAWGCGGSCSYCGIRRAIGGLRSKPLERCLAELDAGVGRGIRSFPLLADDLGAYGLDAASDLPALIDAMLQRHPGITVTLNDLHPRWLLAYLDRLLPHVRSGAISELWCPAQSGSNRILKLMSRFNEAEATRDAFLRMRKEAPGILIHTHLICGFPSETEEDWEESLVFVRESKVDVVLVFPYTKTEGSKAAEMAGHLDPQTVRKRLSRAKRFLRASGVAAMFYDDPATTRARSWFERRAESLLSRGAEKAFTFASSRADRRAPPSKGAAPRV